MNKDRQEGERKADRQAEGQAGTYQGAEGLEGENKDRQEGSRKADRQPEGQAKTFPGAVGSEGENKERQEGNRKQTDRQKDKQGLTKVQ